MFGYWFGHDGMIDKVLVLYSATWLTVRSVRAHVRLSYALGVNLTHISLRPFLDTYYTVPQYLGLTPIVHLIEEEKVPLF